MLVASEVVREEGCAVEEGEGGPCVCVCLCRCVCPVGVSSEIGEVMLVVWWWARGMSGVAGSWILKI